MSCFAIYHAPQPSRTCCWSGRVTAHAFWAIREAVSCHPPLSRGVRRSNNTVNDNATGVIVHKSDRKCLFSGMLPKNGSDRRDEP